MFATIRKYFSPQARATRKLANVREFIMECEVYNSNSREVDAFSMVRYTVLDSVPSMMDENFTLVPVYEGKNQQASFGTLLEDKHVGVKPMNCIGFNVDWVLATPQHLIRDKVYNLIYKFNFNG